MQLNSAGNTKVVSEGMGKVTEFRIASNAKAFNSLINTIYPNKIKAPIRELSTNAYEAHQIVGKEKTPFKVILPSAFNANFVIRDYGPGLSSEDIDNVYTVLFESTKDQSNDLGGAFGLGSKSPFAYTDNFIVTSFHNGTRTVYSMFKENGKPKSGVLVGPEPSLEPSGIEITIAVKPTDVAKFSEEAANIYKYFKTKPIVTGSNSFRHQQVSLDAPTISGTGWDYYRNNNERVTIAVMGNIGYSLEGYTGKYSELARKSGLVITFNIGELEPTPSRENLSFEPHTLRAIESRFEIIVKEYSQKIQDEINKETNYWDAYIKHEELSQQAILPINVTYKGRKFENTYLYKFDKATNEKSYLVRLETATTGRSLSRYKADAINPEKSSIFIIEDKVSYAKTRLTNFVKERKHRYHYIVHQDDVQTLKGLLEIPDSLFILASTLPKPVFAPKSSVRMKSKVLKFDNKATSNHSNHYWDEIEIDDNTTGYYLDINKNKIVINNVEVKPVDFREVLRVLFPTGLPDIYGFKKSYDKTNGTSKLESIEVKINQEIDKIVSAIELEKGKKETYNKLYQLNVRVMNFLKGITNPVIIKASKNLPERINNLSGAVDREEVVRALRKVGLNPVFNPKVDSQLIQDFVTFNKEYPLLGLLSNYGTIPVEEIVCYIEGKNSKRGI